jgi:hypothetical protein
MYIKLADGQTRSIEHLAPMTIDCPCDPIGRALSVRVTFKNHCVTESYDPLRHDTSEILFRDGPGRHRVFCPTRYHLSHRLPQIMTGLPPPAPG